MAAGQRKRPAEASLDPATLCSGDLLGSFRGRSSFSSSSLSGSSFGSSSFGGSSFGSSSFSRGCVSSSFFLGAASGEAEGHESGQGNSGLAHLGTPPC